jgi:hypothetical protein
MKKSNVAALAAVALLFCACIPSVNPFYSEKDITFDTRLVGEWQEKDAQGEPQVWKFDANGTNAYQLTVTEPKGKTGKFDALLFQIKDQSFLDLIAADCNYATNQADLVGVSMFPGHLLVRVVQLEPDLKLAMTDFDWLEKYLKQNPDALPHRADASRGILLTASTRELQKFVINHLGENELFAKGGEMTRLTNSAPAAVPPPPAK